MKVGDLVVVSLPVRYRALFNNSCFDKIHGKIGLVTGFEELVYGEPSRVRVLIDGKVIVYSAASLKRIHEAR